MNKNQCGIIIPHMNKVLHTLDMLALALTNHDHVWSDSERQAYEIAVAELTSGGGCKDSG